MTADVSHPVANPALGWVAIDGPSGSGKSSTARGLAEALRWCYLDTGATYRAATLAAIEAGVRLDDIDVTNPLGSQASATACRAAEEVVAAATIESGLDPRAPSIAVNGRQVDRAIRTLEVTRLVSAMAAIPGVRGQLVAAQRAVALEHAAGIVVEGRDIAAVVLPEAALRVYLTADESARARRRSADPAAEAPEGLDAAAADLARRDSLDQTRADTPAGVPDGSVVIDSSDLGLAQVIDRLLSLCRQVGITTPD